MLQLRVFFSVSHPQIVRHFESHESADLDIETDENSFRRSLHGVPEKYHVMDSFRNLLFGSRQVEGLMFYKMQKNDFDQRNTNLDQFLVLIMVLIMNLTKEFPDRPNFLVQR